MTTLVNESGLQPIEFKVLLLPDKVKKTVGKNNLIIQPEDRVFKEQAGQVKCTLMAMGNSAFTERGERWFDAPEVGDKVLIARYAGFVHEGKDGKDYRFVNDKEIAGIITEEANDRK